jgi:hypothetical protein
MSPVAPSGRHASRALLMAGIAIVVIIGALWIAALGYSHQGSFKGVAPTAPVKIGKTKRLAGSIAGHGPIILSDVSGHEGDPLDIIIQHFGSNPDTRWYAFRAQPARFVRTDRACTWQWQPSQQLFRAACDHSLVLPADGKGGSRYATIVVKGQLYVDFAGVTLSTTTTRPAPTTSTTVLVSGTHKGP